MSPDFAMSIGSGALSAVVTYALLRRWETRELREQLTNVRRSAERLELEAAEDKARLAMFEMGGRK